MQITWPGMQRALTERGEFGSKTVGTSIEAAAFLITDVPHEPVRVRNGAHASERSAALRIGGWT
jgi:hypothetical protein